MPRRGTHRCLDLPPELWGLVDKAFELAPPERYALFALCRSSRAAVTQNIADSFGFNPEQTKAFVSTVLLRKSVFLTGGAGVGKSYVVRQIAETMRSYLPLSSEDDSSSRVAIATPTAAAAKVASTVHIVAKTLHLTFNIRNRRRAPSSSPCVVERGGGHPHGGSAEQLAAEMGIGEDHMDDGSDEPGGLPTAVLDQPTRQRLRNMMLLIIDEISMASKEMIDLVDAALKQARGSRRPFGGCCVLFGGDPLQLAPVCMDPEIKRMGGRIWAFQSKAWRHLSPIQLVQVVRQAGDPRFAEILNRMRFATHTPQDVAWVNANSRKSTENALTAIMPSNNKCNQRNTTMLARLPGLEYHFEPERFCQEVYSRRPWGARRLANHEIPPNAHYPPNKAVRDTLVLKIGARVRCIRNLYTGTYPDRTLDVANGQLGTVSRIEAGRVIVLFDAIGFEGAFERELRPAVWARKQRFKVNGHAVFACVKQLPVTLSWAQTLHSAQGGTITSDVDVDHAAVFPSSAGQWIPTPAGAYVALSRSTSVGAMRLLRPLKASDIVADPVVLAYMKDTFMA